MWETVIAVFESEFGACTKIQFVESVSRLNAADFRGRFDLVNEIKDEVNWRHRAQKNTILFFFNVTPGRCFIHSTKCSYFFAWTFFWGKFQFTLCEVKACQLLFTASILLVLKCKQMLLLGSKVFQRVFRVCFWDLIHSVFVHINLFPGGYKLLRAMLFGKKNPKKMCKKFWQNSAECFILIDHNLLLHELLNCNSWR